MLEFKVREWKVQANLSFVLQGQLVEEDGNVLLSPAKYDIANIHFWILREDGRRRNIINIEDNLREGQHPTFEVINFLYTYMYVYFD